MMGLRVQYKPEIALGHLLTIGAGIIALSAAYYVFVADTKAEFAAHSQRLEQHDKAIEDLQATLKNMPTGQQIRYIEEDLKEMKTDISWLVRQKVEDNGDKP